MPTKISSSPLKKVRLGVVGLGGMGAAHCASLLNGIVPNCELVAVSDTNPKLLELYPAQTCFLNAYECIQSKLIDAILITTPHYSHTPLGIAALQAGLHVMMEKPLSVHKADCEKLLSAHKNPRQVFSGMFNQRTDPRYQKIRSLVTSGKIGKIRRINWIITDWYRTEAYYSSGSWRATWEGEGGGILVNQAIHNLDLFQWIFGMPDNVRGFCQLGRYHEIEVEDDVTAYFDYADGTTAVFITSTGESPGTNRLEVTGDLGKIVLENNQLQLTLNTVSMTQFGKKSKNGSDRPKSKFQSIPLPNNAGEQHIGILKNFTRAILKGETLLAPAAEGINSVILGNAILMSSLQGKTITLPFASSTYTALLKKLILNSKVKKIPKPKTNL